MSEWQPIETAPRSYERDVLVFDPKRTVSGPQFVASYNGDGWKLSADAITPLNPTHWMPLPDVPEAA